MNFDLVIAHLRANVPMFGQRVAGAADFAQGIEDQTWMQSPACYVVPLDEEAEPNDESNALYQLIKERIGVVVQFDNTADRRGQSVTELFAPTRAALFAALLNWRDLDPEHALRGFEAAGGALLDYDRARLFYRWEFVFPTLVTDADGWQLNPPPLTEIDANSDPGEPAPAFKVLLPQ